MRIGDSWIRADELFVCIRSYYPQVVCQAYLTKLLNYPVTHVDWRKVGVVNDRGEIADVEKKRQFKCLCCY